MTKRKPEPIPQLEDLTDHIHSLERELRGALLERREMFDVLLDDRYRKVDIAAAAQFTQGRLEQILANGKKRKDTT